MKYKWLSLILLMFAFSNCVYALDINDVIKPINPLDNQTTNEVEVVHKKVVLTKNDLYNQYAIALERFMQSNVKSSYADFSVLLQSATPLDYTFLKMSVNMADLGFFDLSKLAISKLTDENISYMLKEDVARFYFPEVEISKADEIYLAEMYSNIMFNDQSREVTAELIKNTSLLEKYDYANYLVALGYFKSDDYVQAEKYINTAIAKNNKNVNYKKLKAEIVANGKKPQNALKIMSEIKSQPFLTTEFNKKLSSLEEYLLYKTKKNEFEKKYHLAYYFYYEDDLNKAMRTLQSAFNGKKNNNKNVYALLSKVYFDLKEYEKAQDNALKALKLDSSNPTALWVLGDLAFAKKDYNQALKYYQSMSIKNSALPDEKVAQTYLKLNKEKKAYEIYSKILKTHFESYQAYYNMALLDKTREVEYLKKSVAINPDFKDGWIDLARLETDKNNLDKAWQYLSMAKYIDENYFRYYYYLGLIYKNKGLPADAKRSFMRALKLNPDYKPAKEELSI